MSQLRGLYARYADAPRFRPSTVPATVLLGDIAWTFYHPCAKSVTGTPLMHLVLALAFVDVCES